MAESPKEAPRRAGPSLRRFHPKEEMVLGFVGLGATIPALLISCVLAGPILDGRASLLPCFHKTVLHRECMTCGMTRSFGAMWKGRADLASSYNRGGPALFTAFWIVALTGAGFAAHGFVSNRKIKRRNV